MSSGVMLISLHAMALAGLPDEPRRRLAVQDHRRRRDEHVGRRRIESAAADDQHVVGRRIERLVGIDHDHRTVESQRQLTLVVQMGVIHERARFAAA